MKRLALAAILAMLTWWSMCGLASDSGNDYGRNVMQSWTSVSVGVADLDETLDLWSGTFGLAILAQKYGEDPDLANLWGLSPDDIGRQALLGTPDADTGLIHLVQFNRPGPAVRDGAQVFDLCPKNIDVYVRDLPRRVEELKSDGRSFHNENYSEISAPDGTVFREIHMQGHDAINIVLLEVIGLELPFTQQGYAAVGPLVTIVGNAGAERRFYRDVMGLDVLNDNILEGPEIEQMIGLPPGSALDVSIWGRPGQALGQVEIIEYRGAEGNDLYSSAVPKQRGILHVTYAIEGLKDFTQLLDQSGIPWSDKGLRSILPGTGRFIRFQSPGGMHIEAFEISGMPGS
jgi:catechol 2,3-dioxygenase-like lactoylglutathione lyase family enzyme